MIELFSYEIESLLNQIKGNFDAIKSENARLKAENNKLKNEHYKDEELAALKAENHKLQSYLSSGCYITPEEMSAINQWEAEQERVPHIRILFEFTPVGVVGIAKDIRSEKQFTFRDI